MAVGVGVAWRGSLSTLERNEVPPSPRLKSESSKQQCMDIVSVTVLRNKQELGEEYRNRLP